MSPRQRISHALSRWLLRAVAASLVFFAVAAVSVQFLRTDLNPWQATISQYLSGPWGAFLDAAYYALGAGLTVLGGVLATLTADAKNTRAASLPRWTVGSGLLGTAGMAIVVVAIFRPGPELQTPGLLVHKSAAVVAFVTVAWAVLWHGLRFRHMGSCRRCAGPAIALGAVSLAAEALFAIYDSWPATPDHGFGEKLLVALCWLGVYCLTWAAHNGVSAHPVPEAM